MSFADHLHGVSAIKNGAAFHSTNVDETHAHAVDLISKHRLAVTGKAFEARINHQANAATNFIHMRFGGATVLVDPGTVDDFFLVHLPLEGRSRLFHSKGEARLNTNMAGIVSAASPFRIVWEPDCAQLILTIKRSRLEEVCRAYIGPAYRAPLVLHPEMDLRTPCGAAYRQLVTYALQSLAMLPSPGSAMAHANIEEALISHLLAYHTHNYSHMAWQDASAADSTPRCVRLAEQYMEENLAAPLTLSDIAEHSGVTVRTLMRSFRKFRNQTPMTALREKRLEQARRDLQKGTAASITDIAYGWGFTHLGRFASLYKKHYGESPSQTRSTSEPRYPASRPRP